MPPAKTQTKSLGSMCNFPFTKRMTESCLNSTGTELKTTLILFSRRHSVRRLAFRSLIRVNSCLRYERVTWLLFCCARARAASTALSPPPTIRILLFLY